MKLHPSYMPGWYYIMQNSVERHLTAEFRKSSLTMYFSKAHYGGRSTINPQQYTLNIDS